MSKSERSPAVALGFDREQQVSSGGIDKDFKKARTVCLLESEDVKVN